MAGIAYYDWLNDPESILRYKNTTRNLMNFFVKEGLMTRTQIAPFLELHFTQSAQNSGTDAPDFHEYLLITTELLAEFST
ncbi:MAG: hypothetical protein ACHQUC_06080 [Chlamydiales bacterium]